MADPAAGCMECVCGYRTNFNKMALTLVVKGIFPISFSSLTVWVHVQLRCSNRAIIAITHDLYLPLRQHSIIHTQILTVFIPSMFRCWN